MSPNARALPSVDGVALWLLDLDARDHPEPALSPEEERRAARLAFERDRARYFAAHRQSANGTSLQMPGAVVRSVDTIVLEDR